MSSRKYLCGYEKLQKRENLKNKLNLKKDLWINLLLVLNKTQKKKKKKKLGENLTNEKEIHKKELEDCRRSK